MEQQLTITYYHHSGFSVAVNDRLLVFDYWLGEHDELPEDKRLTDEVIDSFNKVYYFISHEHPDHFDKRLHDRWKKHPRMQFIVSYDMPIGVSGKRMSPGDTLSFPDGVAVTAYESTDLGVSFLVKVDGMSIFHAGDLNFWHWREESTEEEIREMLDAFEAVLEKLDGKPVDLAFFPVDARMGAGHDEGADMYVQRIAPKILIPMHWWGRPEVAETYARKYAGAPTRVIAMTEPGGTIELF